MSFHWPGTSCKPNEDLGEKEDLLLALCCKVGQYQDYGVPWLGIPPNPWTRRAFFEALKRHKADREKHLKKSKTTTEKHKESKDIKKGKVHFEK